MATRATYKIGRTVYYCHWDGYREGAAIRFAKMVAALTVACEREHDGIEDRRGGFEYAFIRGNMDAEPTQSHDAHGDTEYRYTLEVMKDGLALMTVAWRTPGNVWQSDCVMELGHWLIDQREGYVRMVQRLKAQNPEHYADVDPVAEAFEQIPPMVRADFALYGGAIRHEYATAAEAEKIAAHNEKQAARYTADNPNKNDAAERARIWREALSPKGWATAETATA